VEALWVGNAGTNLVHPETKTSRIAIPTEKVQVLLPDKEALFQCRIPAQLPTDLATTEGGAMHIHVILGRLQVSDLAPWD